MLTNETILSSQEKRWLKERRIKRLTDNKEVQIYPMGAERYLASVLMGNKKNRYNIKADIQNKDVLVIPGYGNSGFLFAEAGAKSVTVYDKDPVTIAWIKAFKKYYYYREQGQGNLLFPSIGELLEALTQWYPPLVSLPQGKLRNKFFWMFQPNILRKIYIHYMLSLVNQALRANLKDNLEFNKNIEFYAGSIDHIISAKSQRHFDSAFIPYLLGIKNGIEGEQEIVIFMKKLMKLMPKGNILINPSRHTKEFYITGKRYFLTTEYDNIQSIPTLNPYFKEEDKYWFHTQGLAVFSSDATKTI